MPGTGLRGFLLVSVLLLSAFSASAINLTAEEYNELLVKTAVYEENQEYIDGMIQALGEKSNELFEWQMKLMKKEQELAEKEVDLLGKTSELQKRENELNEREKLSHQKEKSEKENSQNE